MQGEHNSGQSKLIVLRWIARILSGAAFIFFALIKLYEMALPERVPDKWVTNPVLVLVYFALLLVAIIIGWKREGIGGLLVTVLTFVGMLRLILVTPQDFGITLLLLSPFLISGLCWLLYWKQSESHSGQEVVTPLRS